MEPKADPNYLTGNMLIITNLFFRYRKPDVRYRATRSNINDYPYLLYVMPGDCYT
jgi:hypothetical protein